MRPMSPSPLLLAYDGSDDAANERDAAAVVLGARGLGRVESVLLGSVSTAVVAHLHRPVLVIPHRKPSDPS